MESKTAVLFATVATMSMLLAGFAVAATPPQPRVAVLVGIEAGAADQVAKSLGRLGGEVDHVYQFVNALAAVIPADAMERLAIQPKVTYVELDSVKTVTTHTAFLVEAMPWGVDRIDADEVWDADDDLAVDADAPATGAGVVVAVLDTGIDYTHPDLADKFLGGWDFVDGDSDPFDEPGLFQGHGTHVSGTIAAVDNEVGVLGVAPFVGIRMYRVCGTDGFCLTSDIVAAVEAAVADEANVISMSLSGPVPDITERRVMEFAWAEGLVIVAAAGNHGTPQPHFPASFDTVISVGAIEEGDALASFSAFGFFLELVAPGVAVPSTVVRGTGRDAHLFVDAPAGEAREVDANPMEFSATRDVSGEVEFVGLATQEELEGVDLTGKIALIERGEITFQEKVQNVADKDAIGAVIHNNEPGNFFGTLQALSDIPAASISQEDGHALRAILDSGETLEMSLSVTATDYAFFSGTSMATPHVAGAAALTWSADQALSNDQVRSILQETAEDLGDLGKDLTFGFGLVDAESAVFAALGDA